jgi:hypothetical protein
MRHPRPNQAMQPTADRFDASFQMISTLPFQFALVLASGG